MKLRFSWMRSRWMGSGAPRRRSRIAGEDGLAMIEVAAVAPLLLLLLFGIVEFGILFARLQVLTNASSAGAREAGLFRTDCATTQRSRADAAARNVLSSGLGIDVGTVSLDLIGNCSSTTVTYIVRYENPIPVYSSLAGFFGDPSPRTIPLEQQTAEFNSNSIRSSSN